MTLQDLIRTKDGGALSCLKLRRERNAEFHLSQFFPLRFGPAFSLPFAFSPSTLYGFFLHFWSLRLPLFRSFTFSNPSFLLPSHICNSSGQRLPFFLDKGGSKSCSLILPTSVSRFLLSSFH